MMHLVNILWAFLWTSCGHLVGILWTSCGHLVDILWTSCGHSATPLSRRTCGHLVDILWAFLQCHLEDILLSS